MPRYISKDGQTTVETSNAREAVQLKAQGFTEQTGKRAEQPKPADKPKQ